MQSKGELNLLQDSDESGPLDYKITLEKLDTTSYVLKPNKTTGADSFSNEMIKGLLLERPSILLKFFNAILEGHSEINEWLSTIITPIFKKGEKTDPQNYRGISVISCFLKFYEAILY